MQEELNLNNEYLDESVETEENVETIEVADAIETSEYFNDTSSSEPEFEYVEPLVVDYSFVGEPKDRKFCTITFADGTVLDEVWVNGDYYVTFNEVTDKILSEDNLMEVHVLSEGREQIYFNLECTDLHKFEGKYWFILKEYEVKDLQYEELSAKIDYIAMMEGLEV